MIGYRGRGLRTLQAVTLMYTAFCVQTVQPACSDDNTADGGNRVEMLMWLTDPCRYDRWTRPIPPDGNSKTGAPTRVSARVYVYFLGSVEAQQLHFTAHLLIRYRWRDDRLVHSSSKSSIQGENKLKERVWTPHVYIVNEHDSNIMGSGRQDILVTVQPDGTVLYSARLKVSLLCMMNLQKFPFDQQTCPLILESWTYNNTHLELVWEHDSPAVLNSNLRMTEYNLVSIWTDATVSEYTLLSPSEDKHVKENENSPLSVEHVHYYGKFGTSTMLTFITLSRNIGSSLPKVSYIKATEIWFLVCTAFIFGSLVEFAFVNTIWRRKKNVELKKVNSKHIFKSTLTPQMQRKSISVDSGIDRGTAGASPTVTSGKLNRRENRSRSLLTVDNLNSNVCTNPEPLENFSIRVPTLNDSNKNIGGGGLFTLTPQEIAQWIDQRSRIAFPAAFLVFNCFYWLYVYV
ncbi:pH-sensitive chloride channel 2-like isoform X2 [Aphis gossypii]|uniref:pH-sensitive chloride channel 2-like isoform X2 n=1 Tax=Aphis gossypii TaxID=80765 RepID=UPI00215989DB|nr:pH-sensitive chloride channel 2-like isoform X2 [Aphis gossypii]